MLDEGRWSSSPRETLAGLSVRTVKSVRQQVVQPLRRPAADGRDRQGRAVEQQAGHPGRADRRARRRADRPGARAGAPARRQRPGRRAHLAQHERRVRGRRPHRGAVPGPDGRAQVPATEVTHQQVVELITAGRSGNLGIADSNLELIEADVVGDIGLPGDADQCIDLKKTGADE